MMIKRFLVYSRDLRDEFSGYNAGKFSRDVIAGLTVSAVALPLALAFGVGGGADAAAGLITAIIAGIVIGMLSGAPYQISGPTGAMTAILVTLVSRYSLTGVFVAGLISGIILLIAGIFRFGRVVGFLPTPVITGFTSGIAIIIALGQLDNFFGVTSEGEIAVMRVVSYFTNGFNPDMNSMVIGLSVIVLMILWPKKWHNIMPSSLFALIVVTFISIILDVRVARVGTIPSTLLPDNRLNIMGIEWKDIGNLILPAISIAALGMIESLLCGASASRSKPGLAKFNPDRELVAQGIGNIILPFFGGIPATAAIARTSVAVKAGAVTRVTNIIHALVLLASMFIISPVMSRIPLAALAGILMVTAFNMNEWGAIRYIFGKRFKGAAGKFLITMIATVVFDLTIAIVIGVAFSILLFVVRISNITVDIGEVDPERLGLDGNTDFLKHIKVIYFTGPLFFAAIDRLEGKLHDVMDKTLVFSMRGVPLLDTSGAQHLLEIIGQVENLGGKILFCCVQPGVKITMNRAGITETVGENAFYPDARQAIMAQAATE